MFVSTYSFEYLYDEVPIEELNFTSKAEGYTNDLVTNWHLNGKNIETIEIFVLNDKNHIAIGTHFPIYFLQVHVNIQWSQYSTHVFNTSTRPSSSMWMPSESFDVKKSTIMFGVGVSYTFK